VDLEVHQRDRVHPVRRSKSVLIREVTGGDWPAVWSFLRDIVAAGETFPYEPNMSESDARAMWFVEPPGRTVVAITEDGSVAGTANMYANRPGGGSHIASGSLMVDPTRWGHGVGRALTEDMIDWASAKGFRGIQFNAVVEGNERAERLYRSLEFEILGTVPEGFHHPTRGYVGLHVMYRRLA
jgi:L-amino acid N-acyltransferase YncA